jgi:hypothetical protein
MEQDIKQSAGNGDWTASEDTAWGLDAAAASLETSTVGSAHTSTHIRSSRFGCSDECSA